MFGFGVQMCLVVFVHGGGCSGGSFSFIIYWLRFFLMKSVWTLLILMCLVLGSIWNSAAPSKVAAFLWKLLHNRVLSKDNMTVRAVILVGGSIDCAVCVGKVETSVLLFLHCKFAAMVWFSVFQRLWLFLVLPPNFSVHFECLSGAARCKPLRKVFWLIWHTTVWSIWKAINGFIFS